MAQKFNIDILLKIAQEGGDVFNQLVRNFESIIEKGNESARVLNGLKVSNKVVTDVQKIKSAVNSLNDEIGQLQNAKFDVQGASVADARLRAIIKDLQVIQREARKVDDDLVFNNAAVAEGNARKLLKTLQETGRTASKINDDFERLSLAANLSKQLSNVISQVKVLEKELNSAIQKGDQLKVNDITPNLKKAAGQLVSLGTEFKKIGEVSKLQATVGQIQQVSNLQKQVKALTPEFLAANKAKNELFNITSKAVIGGGLSAEFGKIKRESAQLTKELQAAIKAGDTTKVSSIIVELNNLKLKLAELQKQYVELGKVSRVEAVVVQQNNIESLIRQVKTLTDVEIQANKAKNELLNVVGPAIIGGGLSGEFAKIKQEANELSKSLTKAIQAGDSAKIAEITSQLLVLKERLSQLQKEYVALGKVSRVEAVIVQQGNIDALIKKVQNLTQAELEANKTKVIVEAQALNNFADVKKSLATLERDIQKFVKEHGSINVQAKVLFDDRAKDIQKKLGQLGSVLPQGQEQAYIRTNLAVETLRNNISKLQAPRNFFAEFGKGFKSVIDSAGGVGGALKGLAAGFRLAGTTAFVSGFRTAGFALTAFASIIQNVLPLLDGLAKGLIALGPPGYAILTVLTGLGAAFTIVGAKLTLTFGAIASVIPVGFRFNQLLEDAANGAAAVAQNFQTFQVNGKSLEQFFGRAVGPAEKFEVAVQAVRDQLPLLEQGALGTLFTTEELVGSLEQTIIALGGLAPSLEDATKLTVKFAGVAGILGLSQDKLASSIQQVVAGTGRITNKLQQLFNQTKDSKGIELTAKRIRDLRAAGGTKLFDELTFALNTYSKAVIEANRRSFTGVISNFQDLFGLISRQATEKAFDNVRLGLNKVFDAFVKFDSKNEIKLAPELEKLIKILDSIFDKVSKDLVAALQTVAGYFDDFVEFLDQNYEVILSIYDLTVFIGEQFLEIIDQIGRLLLFSTKTSEQFKAIKVILTGISLVLAVIKGVIAESTIAVGSLIVGFSFLGQTIFKILRYLLDFADFLIPDFGAIDLIVDKLTEGIAFLGETSQRGTDLARTGFENLKDAANDAAKAADLFNKANGKVFRPKDAKRKITSVGSGQAEGDKDKEKKAAKDRIKSLLALENQLAEALRKLALQRNQNELKLAQDRLKQQQTLIQAALDQNLISQQEASRKSLQITQKEIDNEIRLRSNQLILLNEERLDKERNFALERAEILEKGEKGKKKGGLSPVELKNKLEEFGLKLLKERVELQTQEEALLGEINALELSRNESRQQFIFDTVKRTKETQKELEAIRLTVSELKGQNTEQAVNLKTLAVVQERLETIQALENEIVGIRKVRRDTTNPAILALLNQQEAIAKERLELVQQEVVLRQQNIRLEAAEAVADKVKFDNQKRVNELQRQLSLGIIDQTQYNRELIAENIRVKEALQEILKTEEKILSANPFNEEQRRKVADLREEIAGLQTQLTDEKLLKATSDIKDSLTDFLVNIQDQSKNAADSIKDFANSVLQTFRRLLADKLVKDLFSNLFPKEGQTQGKPGGIIASVLRGLGLGVEDEQKKAEARAKEKGPILTKDETGLLDQLSKQSDAREAVFGKSLDDLSSIIDQGTILIRQALSNLANSISGQAVTLRSLGTEENPLPSAVNIDKIGKEFASGGFVPGKVSNGEYRIQPKAVQKYGPQFLGMLNNFGSGGSVKKKYKYASGGLSSLFDYSGGGAKLINRPNPIYDNTVIPKRKKVGKFRKTFGNILSFAAPFLGLIPGIGPLLQLGTGIAGGALTGDGAKGSILGGIFGGLGNLSGFTKAGGLLGKTANFFEGQGNLLLSLFGGRNTGSLGGSSLFKLLKRFGLGKGKIVDSPISRGNSNVYAKSGGLIPKYASGGLADALGIFSLFGGLLGRGGSSNSSQQLPEIQDPDLKNINRYGSALGPLREMGIIPDFFYKQETIDYLNKQAAGTLNSGTTNQASSSFGSSLTSLLPLLALFAQNSKAKGGMVPNSGLVKGPGTGTSDSIFAMLSAGEFVINADSTRALGTDLLDSINAGKFAQGGIVGANSYNSIPANRFSPNINVQAPNYNAINLLDPNLLEDYLNTTSGTQAFVQVISRNPKKFSQALRTT